MRQVFGGEFLGAQKVERLRGFFAAFFALDETVWGGFLAGWPGLPGNEYHDAWNKRLAFGLSLFVRFPPEVALSMMVYAVTFSLEYGGSILRSFATPLFGDGVAEFDRPRSRERLAGTYVDGDLAAKREALAMLRESRGEPSPQVAELGARDLPGSFGVSATGTATAEALRKTVEEGQAEVEPTLQEKVDRGRQA